MFTDDYPLSRGQAEETAKATGALLERQALVKCYPLTSIVRMKIMEPHHLLHLSLWMVVRVVWRDVKGEMPHLSSGTNSRTRSKI